MKFLTYTLPCYLNSEIIIYLTYICVFGFILWYVNETARMFPLYYCFQGSIIQLVRKKV